MPTVGMKKFSYTAKGKKAAKDYAKLQVKKQLLNLQRKA